MDQEWPEWWSWELELSLHALDRMIDRDFSETDLRTMLDDAQSVIPDYEPGRWLVRTSHQRCGWEVIVEPEQQKRILKVVTAYPVE